MVNNHWQSHEGAGAHTARVPLQCSCAAVLGWGKLLLPPGKEHGEAGRPQWPITSQLAVNEFPHAFFLSSEVSQYCQSVPSGTEPSNNSLCM